jgi:hypothetical protein
MGMSTHSRPQEIGQGNFGVIYRPPLVVEEKELNEKYGNDNYITKVYYRYEGKVNKTLLQIDPEQKYFIYPFTMGTVKSPPQVQRFVLLEQKAFNQVGFMQYAGTDLSCYKSLGKKITCARFIKYSYNLILGLAILHVRCKMIHGDIAYRNILILNGVARFCDIEWNDVAVTHNLMRADIKALIEVLLDMTQFVPRKGKYLSSCQLLVSLFRSVHDKIDTTHNAHKIYRFLLSQM